MSGSDSPSAPEFAVNEEDVTYNGALLMKHVMEKGWQTGGVLALVATPIGAFRAFRQQGSWEPGEAMASRALRYARKSAIPTVLVTGALGLARIAQYEDKGAALADRAYRLHFNGSQNRCDQFSRVRGEERRWDGDVGNVGRLRSG